MPRRICLILSFLLTLGLLVFSYWVTNLRYPISGEKLLLAKLETARSYFQEEANRVNDSVLFINVAFDKALYPVKDEFGIPDGKIQATDREKLLRLLTYLKMNDNYRYILLDIFMGNDIHTEWDKELFATIESMDRIVIPCHSDMPLADMRLMKKAGLADYYLTLSESDFVKYPYLNDSIKSIPIKMYEDITGRKVTKHGIFYLEGWNLVRKSIVLTFDILANDKYDDDGNIVWYNLGMELLDDSIPEIGARGSKQLWENPDLTKNKYIVVGAFNGNDDNHITFQGNMSGAVINFNAFISLLNKHHYVSFMLIVILFIVFFIMCYITLQGKSFQNIVQVNLSNSRNKVVSWIAQIILLFNSWIGYSTLLSLLCISTYLVLGEAYDIFITATAFYLLSRIVRIVDKINKPYKSWIKEKQL